MRIILLVLSINFILFAKVLNVGSATWKPYIMKDNKGKIVGISVDIIKEIAKRMGYKIKINIYPARRVHAMMDKGVLDINFADSKVWNSKADQENFYFTEPYTYIDEYIYSNQYFTKKVKNVSDLIGFTIGIVYGYYYEILEPLFNNKKIKKQEIYTEDGLLKSLLANKIQLAIFDDKLIHYMRHNVIKFDKNKIRKIIQVSKAPLGLKIQKTNKNFLNKLNKVIKQMKQDGTIDKIIQKYN